MESNKHFTAIVVGENPDEIMKKYDLTRKVEPYVVYKLSDVTRYKQNAITAYKYMSENDTMPEYIRKEYKERINDIQEMSDTDFYLELTEDFDIDPATGDAICDINKDGHYHVCNLGKNLAMPLINKDGKEVFQARKCDIDWDKIHLANQEVYKAAWEMVMGNRKPVTDEEKIIYENMKNRTAYFEFFGTEDRYVLNSTAFWGLAFVTEDKWEELTDDIDQVEWIGNFYDKFISNLPDNTLISVFECIRN